MESRGYGDAVVGSCDILFVRSVGQREDDNQLTNTAYIIVTTCRPGDTTLYWPGCTTRLNRDS